MWTRGKTIAVVLLALLAGLASSISADGVDGTYRSTDQDDHSSLQLRADGSFLYQARGDSCWTWTDVQGQWTSQGSILKLVWDVEVDDDSSEIVCHAQAEESRGISVEVLNADNEPLSGVWVTINHRQPALETDAQGFILVPVVLMANQPADDDLAVEWIEVESERWSPRQEVPPGYWSQGQAVDCQGYGSFTVVLDLEPDTQVQQVTQTYRFENDALLLLSSYDPHVREPQYLAKQLQKGTRSD